MKEVVKLVVSLMVDDIWSNFDNYKLQQRVIHKKIRSNWTSDSQLEEPSQKLVVLNNMSNSMRNSKCKR
jgi:hypothetical protein